jgi:hypothetical protein
VHFIVSLSQNQQMHKVINKYKMYLQPLHMFGQINCHPQGVDILPEDDNLFAETYVGVVNTFYTC